MSKRLRKAQYKLIEDELRFYHSTKELMEKEVNVTLALGIENTLTRTKVVAVQGILVMKWKIV